MSEQSSNIRKKKRMNRVHLIAATICTLLLLLFGCAPSTEDVDRTTDQTKLAKMAIEAKHWMIRRAAVGKLTDQALLARIAVEDKDWIVRRAAVEKLTDPVLLARIAKDEQVRRAAAEKLTDPVLLAQMGMSEKSELIRKVTDQDLLAKLAVEGQDEQVRRAAVGKLTDQALLARIAVETQDPGVRSLAVENLTDQDLLAKLAVEGQDEQVRRAAVGKLTDQALLARIAVEAKRLDIRVTAIDKVTDQVLLRQWAEKDPKAAIRQASVRRIADEKFLVQRLPTEPSATARAAIIETLHGKNSLREVALTAYHQEERKQALQRLRALGDRASDVATAHNALTGRVEALAAETDSGKLLALALAGEFDVLRGAAARRLSDPAALEQAALRGRDHEVSKILLAKLKDKAMLNRIVAAADDRAMRLAAAQKAGAKSWQEIFSAATARGATVEMLGDALAAISLSPAVRADAKDGVQEACLNLIRRGDESRIPEMVDLIEGYGDKRLAEDYLNCGQPDLDAAAREWAHRRGYSASKGAGSHRATWGSGS